MKGDSPDPVKEALKYQRFLLGLLGDDDASVVQSATPGALRLLVADAREDLRASPEPGEWSVLQCVSHILDAEIVYSGRYRWILAQDEPVMIGYDQDLWVERTHDPTEDPWVMLDIFEGLRLSNVELWKRSSADQRNRIGRHDERGPETFDLSFRLIAGHDRLHVNQAKIALAAVRKQL